MKVKIINEGNMYARSAAELSILKSIVLVTGPKFYVMYSALERPAVALSFIVENESKATDLFVF